MYITSYVYQMSITLLTSRPDDPSNSPSVRSTISSEITAAVSKFISLLENNYEYEHTSLLHPPSFLTHPPPPFILNSPFTSTCTCTSTPSSTILPSFPSAFQSSLLISYPLVYLI